MGERRDRAQDARIQELEDREAGRGYQDTPQPDGSSTVTSAHDREQDERVRQLEERATRAETALADLDAFVITPAEAGADPSQTGASANQRLRIQVPNVLTTIAMGTKAARGAVRPEDAGDANYDGFGVGTLGHIFMDANGDGSTATIQSKGDAVVQSEGGLSLGGQGGLIAASKGGATISGGGGVSIIGGAPNNWVSNRTSDGTTPGSAPWIKEMAPINGTIAAIGTGIDAFVALWNAGAAVLDAKRGNEPMPWRKGALAATAYAGGIFGGLVSALGAAGSIDGTGQSLNAWGSSALSKAASHAGGVYMHGTAGVIVTSTVTMGLYSLMGTTIASPLGVLVKGGFADFHALRDASVKALKGSLTLSASTEATLSAEKSVAIGSDKGTVTIGGAEIHLGARAGAGGQAGTKTIVLDADNLGLHSKKSSRLTSDKNVEVTGSKLTRISTPNGPTIITGKTAVAIASSAGSVTLGSPKSVALRSGDFLVNVKKDKAVIGKAGKLPDPPAEPEYKPLQPQPKSKKKRVQEKWAKARSADEQANASKKEAYDKQMDAHQKKIANMKDATVGIVIKSSGIELVCDGHKLQLDSSKIKTPSLIVQK